MHVNVYIGRQVYLGKQSFARAWRPVHEDVPVQAVVLPRVPCCDGDVTHTLFQRGLQDAKMHLYQEVTKLYERCDDMNF